MMKFATYENIVEMTYKHLIPTPKDQCSKPLQLGVSFGSGYVAGVFCAAVSHPADNLVSFLNNSKGATVGDVSPHCTLQNTDELQLLPTLTALFYLYAISNHCAFYLFIYLCIRLSRTLACWASSPVAFLFAF